MISKEKGGMFLYGPYLTPSSIYFMPSTSLNEMMR